MELPVDYGSLTPAERKVVREEYIKLQEGKCYYCKGKLSDSPPSKIMKKRIIRTLFPENFFKWPVHLHHSHETGLTIGAVHCYCNAVLWQYEHE